MNVSTGSVKWYYFLICMKLSEDFCVLIDMSQILAVNRTQNFSEMCGLSMRVYEIIIHVLKSDHFCCS